MKNLCTRKLRGLALVLCLVTLLSGGLVVKEPKVEVWSPYTIHSGDSLWSIALQASQGQEDTRAVLDRIKTYNKISNKTLYPGEEIYIPLIDQDL